MNQKLITLMLLLIAAICLIYIDFVEDWVFIVFGLISAVLTLLSASLLLISRYRKQWVMQSETIE